MACRAVTLAAAALTLSVVCATPLPPNGLMAGLQQAWLSASSADHQNSPRVFFGHFLAGIDALVRPFWDEAPPAARAAAMARATAPPAPTPYPNPLPGPAWRWMPELLGSALPAAPAPLTFSSPCFQTNAASGAFSADGSEFVVTITSSAPSSPNCTDMLWLGTVEWMDFLTLSAAASAAPTSVVRMPVTSRPKAREWVQRKGALVMRFLDPDPLTIAYEVLSTISLFIPQLISSPLTPEGAELNYQFLHDYVNITMEPRLIQNVTIDPNLIQSGDLLMIHRADGLSTLESWGTGATTSHVVSFIRSETTGELFCVESQSNGADWPIDRIQLNTWADWQKMAAVASYGDRKSVV